MIDTVGGALAQRSFATLKPEGILVSSVSQPDSALAQRYGVRTSWFIVSVTTAALEQIGNLLDDGTLRTNVGTTLGLAGARKAHEMLAGTISKPPGKIVLDVDAGSLTR